MSADDPLFFPAMSRHSPPPVPSSVPHLSPSRPFVEGGVAFPFQPIVTRAEAKAAGLKRYFTGVECDAGHISERQTANRRCLECGRLNRIARHRADPVGARQKAKKRRDDNWEQFREKERQYEAANQEKILTRRRGKYWEDPEKARADHARWTDPERHRLASQKWREDNPELARQICLNWRANNPEAARAADATKRARRRGADGTYTADDIARIRGLQRDTCAYCPTKLKGRGHIDHIIALSKGGSNWPSNLQLTCDACNMHKHAKDPLDFARQRGLLL